MKSTDTKVVVYTRQFPKPTAETDGLFTAQMVGELNNIADVTVVCPVPWCPKLSFFKRWPAWYSNAEIPRHREYKGVDVFYPKFLVIPILARFIQPLFQVLSTLPLLARLKKQKQVEVINAHNLYPDGVGASMVGKLLKLPVVQTSLGSDINSNLNSSIRLSQIKWAMNNSVGVSAKSNALVKLIKTLVRKDLPIEWIPNGVNTSRFDVCSDEIKAKLKLELSLVADTRYLLFVGRLDEVKGLIYLVEALGRLEQSGELKFVTLLVGDGPERNALLDRVRELGIEDKIVFVGKVGHETVPKYIHACDAFCLPSLNEGMPNVVLEALACGRPVVASRVGGVPELVDETNGEMVPSGDSEVLASSIKRVFENQWCAEAVAESVSWADWSVSAQKYLNALEHHGLNKRVNDEKVD